MNWHHKAKQPGDEHHKAQLTIHLCHREQSHPERQDGTEEVGELQRAVWSDAVPVLGPRDHVTPVVQL